ncbi:MAG: hypothetical protein ABL921_11540, partial [Pirellula sp.]
FCSEKQPAAFVAVLFRKMVSRLSAPVALSASPITESNQCETAQQVRVRFACFAEQNRHISGAKQTLHFGTR